MQLLVLKHLQLSEDLATMADEIARVQQYEYRQVSS